MSLTELLLSAKAKKAEEFLFVVGSEPRIRLPSGWTSLRESPALMTEWNLLQQSLLSTQQKTQLDARGVVSGEASFESVRIGFSFFQQDSTMKAVLDMNLDGGKQEVQLPPSLLETCLRMKGLVLLSGPGEAGQVWALHRILQKMSEEKSFVGVVYSRKAFPQVKESKAVYLYHNHEFARAEDQENLMAGVDMVVFDGFSDEQSFCEAMALAERGLFVIYSMKAPSVTNALRRCMSVLSERYAEHGAARFAEVLSLAAGQYPVASLAGEKIFAHEVLLMKPQVRQLIEQEDIKNIDVLLTGSLENSGILTLNQSLLQHLIRRRVDLKTAFEVSRDPDSLDQLLKKVGI
ncbi:type IV pilus twitching motility protein PilT [Bdellovibrio reynosensis]|uniref:Type IV pilus twitching motility protein PilT n=1 Tax=Bdellovibrio reynosensis TaxID=2835041 RepID=A0ABY4CD73_9BACT|nr:type IV pilus twitching motility protein PilT [Bdellovibrio reynosensis]UOF02399.1 type IV pilus twitching motility protein PilT [Bdellovibrio reynosensis]